MAGKFNPFTERSGQYGAPMGRHGHDAALWSGDGILRARHMGGDGYYDRGGAYWGHSRVYAVFTRDGGFCAYVESSSREAAIRKVRTLSGFRPERRKRAA